MHGIVLAKPEDKMCDLQCYFFKFPKSTEIAEMNLGQLWDITRKSLNRFPKLLHVYRTTLLWLFKPIIRSSKNIDRISMWLNVYAELSWKSENHTTRPRNVKNCVSLWSLESVITPRKVLDNISMLLNIYEELSCAILNY